MKNDISGRNLRSLTPNSLKTDLNIGPLGHRSNIVEHIKKLFKERKNKEDFEVSKPSPSLSTHGDTEKKEHVLPHFLSGVKLYVYLS